jgi:sRNA-binding protein
MTQDSNLPQNPSAPTEAPRRTERRSWRPPWVQEFLTDWQNRWPAIFTSPVPLAVGISGQIKEALEKDGVLLDDKTIGVTLSAWTKHGAYLRMVMRGKPRRNLDGSEAGVPDDAARKYAQRILDEREARRRDKVQQKQNQKAPQLDINNQAAV